MSEFWICMGLWCVGIVSLIIVAIYRGRKPKE